ncbi:MAG: prepilin peptidase [Clostridia bacterium]|nr:prepilin peptidase [Clostridia bacterium]
MQDIFLVVFSFLFGMAFGSFANVCIYRVPEKKSLWFPPSACPACGYRLRWNDNIPVVSYLMLGGKCRSCKAGISFQYPLVEMLTGFLFALVYLNFGFSLDTLFVFVITTVLVVITGIDYKTMIIPNGTVLVLIIIGVLYSGFRLVFPGMFISEITIWDPVIGFFAASIPLYLIAIASKGGMGGGDIKLMAAAGLFLGWKGVLLAMFIGSVAGAIVSLVLIAFKLRNRKDLIPFGPYLCFGIFLAANYAPGIIAWYLGLFSI